MKLQKEVRNEALLELEILRKRIQQLEAREAQRREAEELYGNIVNNSHTGFYIIQDKKFQFVNSYIQKMTGYREDELIGRDAIDHVHPHDRDAAWKRVVQYLKTGQSSPFEYRIITRDGKIRWVVASVSPVFHHGKRAIFGSLLDITEHKQAAEDLNQSLKRLKKTMESTVHAMSLIIETRDPYTSGHQEQVARICYAIGRDMGLQEERLKGLHMSAVIHDLGKIYIPAEILSKPGRLSDMETQMMKMHPEQGYHILKTIEFPYPVAEIVYQHHERMNGSGYPRGLTGKDILLEAKILGVADVLDAMAAHRPYRAAVGIDQAVLEISQNRGFLYDPVVVDVCLKLLRERGFPFE